MRRERAYMATALERDGVELRVLLLDPSLIPARMRCRPSAPALTPQNVDDIFVLAGKFGSDRVQGKFYTALPFGPVYIIDDDVYWGIYPANADAMSYPAYYSRLDTDNGRAIESSFRAMWDTGNHRSGALALPGPNIEDVRRQRLPDVAAKVALHTKRLSGLLVDIQLTMPSKSGILVLARHAQTDLNAAKIFTGHLDIGINYIGKAVAEKEGERIAGWHWHRVVCSPMRRAVETARALLGDAADEVELRDELRERRMGSLEGFSKDTYAKSMPVYRGIDLVGAPFAKPEDGESYAEVFLRLAPWLEQTVEDVREGKRIFVCAHEGSIRMILMALEGHSIEDAIHMDIANVTLRAFSPKT